MFKSFLKLVATWLIVFGFSFLIGSFYQGSFDVGQWTEEAKSAVIIAVLLFTSTSFMGWLFSQLDDLIN